MLVALLMISVSGLAAVRQADEQVPISISPGPPYFSPVLHAPFEEVYPLEPGWWTRIYIGEQMNGYMFWMDGFPYQVTGKIGYGMRFTGDDYIRISDGDPTLDFGWDDFKITFWVKTTSTKINNTICDKRDSQGIGYHVTLYAGRPLLQICDSGLGMRNYWNSSSTAINDGNWHYVSIQVDRDNSTGGRIYVDYVLVKTFNPDVHTGSLNNSADFYMGKHKDYASYNFDGTLDEYRHYRFIPK